MENILCPFACDNKTEFGYCRTTACISPKYGSSRSITLNRTLNNEWMNIADKLLEELAKIIDVHLIMSECENKVNAYSIAADIKNNDYRKERHGKWEYDHKGKFKCSHCGICSNSKPNKGKEKFCPECGAKMDL